MKLILRFKSHWWYLLFLCYHFLCWLNSKGTIVNGERNWDNFGLLFGVWTFPMKNDKILSLFFQNLVRNVGNVYCETCICVVINGREEFSMKSQGNITHAFLTSEQAREFYRYLPKGLLELKIWMFCNWEVFLSWSQPHLNLPSVAYHIETGHLICTAKCSTGLKWVRMILYYYYCRFAALKMSLLGIVNILGDCCACYCYQWFLYAIS